MRVLILIVSALTLTLLISCYEMPVFNNPYDPQNPKTYGPCPDATTVIYNNKTYNTVQIETQCWLKENLDIGTRIIGNQKQSNNSIIEKYCYGDDTANCTKYGGLYQWNEAMQYVTTSGAKGICPTGWHIPTKTEFETLKATVVNNGNALKREDQGSSDGLGSNTSGFSALLAGYRDYNGFFGEFNNHGNFWSSTASYYMHLSIYDSGILLINVSKESGFCVRCLKD